MSVNDPQELVRRAHDLVALGRWPDAEILLIEAWRLAQLDADDAARGDIAFRIAAAYRVAGSADRARLFDAEAMRFQYLAFGIS